MEFAAMFGDFSSYNKLNACWPGSFCMQWIEFVHNLSKIIELIHSRTREKLLQTLPNGVKFHFEMCNTFDDFAGMVNLRLDETAKQT